jgi:hypothetical protein
VERPASANYVLDSAAAQISGDVADLKLCNSVTKGSAVANSYANADCKYVTDDQLYYVGVY